MRTLIAPGVYFDSALNSYIVRPKMSDGSRTWRTLNAASKRAAIIEGAEKMARHRRWLQDQSVKSPFEGERQMTFGEAAEFYTNAGCPSRDSQARDEDSQQPEKVRIANIIKILGKVPLSNISQPVLFDYKDERLKLCGRGVRTTGLRTVEMDWNTISNVMSFCVNKGWIPANPIRYGRPKLCKPKDVRHCREVSIETGDQLHAMANTLFNEPKSEVFGWMVLFAGLFGSRREELVVLDLNAACPNPGYMDESHIFLHRAKGGINPWCELTQDQKDMLMGFKAWHSIRHSNSTWFFPGRTKGQAVYVGSFNHAVTRASEVCGFDHVTPHGLRSFYVTRRRGEGASDVQIAAELGDVTASLMSTTYGNTPANWIGRPTPSCRPTKDAPAWDRWLPKVMDGLKEA